MPSWPARLHLGSPTPSPGPKSRTPKSPPYREDHVEDSTYHDQPLHGVPVIALTGTSSPSRLSHGRSYSHPFPSIFGSGKKAEKTSEINYNDGVSETLIESPIVSTGLASKDHRATNWISLQNAEKDLVTGRCITCDSLVRWPGHLDVFRCTVCLMVNDLKPRAGLSMEGCEAQGPSTTTPSSNSDLARKVPCLSLDRTRNLIDEGISVYFQSRLEQGSSYPSQRSHMQNKRDDITNPSLSSLPGNPGFGNSNSGQIVPTMPSPSRAPPPPPSSALQGQSLKVTSVASETPQQHAIEPPRPIFRQLESYIATCFSSVECLNTSFLTFKSHHLPRAASESTVLENCKAPRAEDRFIQETRFPELDAKTLLLGDFAENGTWWTGRGHLEQPRSQGNAFKVAEGGSEEKNISKSPRINWSELDEWYHAIVTVGYSWRQRLQKLQEGNVFSEKAKAKLITASTEDFEQIEEDFAEACGHAQRALLKVTENLLRRPGRPLKTSEDCRFLLILLTNPLLYMPENGSAVQSAISRSDISASQNQRPAPRPLTTSLRQPSTSGRRSPSTRNGSTGKHSGIVKRILGLVSNLPSDCHQVFIIWFSRLSEVHFRRLVDLIGSFVTYRLTRHNSRKRSNSHDPHGGLIPSVSSSGPGPGSSAQLHAALGISGVPNSPDRKDAGVPYSEDWQLKAAARVMSLLFSANNQGSSRTHDGFKVPQCAASRLRAGSAARNQAHRHGQILATNAFYNTLLDYSDLVADFEAWESRRGRFSFCQYPMFLSIWAKIRIMEHDARRQMEIKAREAFFHSIMSRKAINQYLVLKVRRNCLVEDSLRSVSEVVGSGQEEIKKGLRIEFLGEEGLDSGGLRKEWFLLLVREVFDPEHGLFVYDEDSHYCYFNPGTFETSDQFFLVGAVLGLAIYNSTILDVALPPFAFRKLLASAPNYTGPATSSLRPSPGYTLEDLAEFRPTLAKGLRQLLEFDGDVKETFCRDFVAVGERYGQLVETPLCSNGENRAVTNSNRNEFVELYIKYLLDTSVARQYEPFKRGFFTVCGGNALSLFRPEEIELLVRGSDEPLDVATLRTVAIYDGWGKGTNPSDEPVVDWFWDAFGKASAKDQRKLLSFITSSDRIPAMGATSLVIKITCLGDHNDRFPIARTCFNMLGLYRYRNRSVLEEKLWRAVIESEGFGMK